METLVLKNINLLSKERFDGVENPAPDELYAVSSSGLGKPSDRYIDLTLGASGTQYTAPADGQVWLQAQSSVADGLIALSTIAFNAMNRSQNKYSISVKLLVTKGKPFNVVYDGTLSNVYFRFIFDEGEI